MRRFVALKLIVLGAFLARSAPAATSVTVPPGGGLEALTVVVDLASRQVRYSSCKDAPCPLSAASPSLALPAGETPIDAKTVTLGDVMLAGGRHIVRVKVPLGGDAGAEAPAWEALLAAGVPPLFAGATGWSRGELGERAGIDVRQLAEGDHNVLVVGDIREDLRICGDDATLLDPRGLDPKTMTFHGATLQRLGATRRDAATPLEATPRRGPPEPALAPLLAATDASSALGSAAALTDGDAATSWSEARPGRGQGEFVLLRTPFDVPIVRFAVTVTPSTPKPDGAAPETFYLATGAGTYEVTLPEDAWSHPGEAYDITLPAPLQTACVALVLGDAFTRGKAHPEVTVAELTAYSAFDHRGAVLADVAPALAGGDARAQAAAALLERAGAGGVAAMEAAYDGLDSSGRALAINVAASASSCAASGKLLVIALGDADEVVRAKATAKLHEPACGREALPSLVLALKTPAARRRVAPLVALVGRAAALEPLVDVLGEGTADDREAVRSAVAYAGRTAPPDALGALLGAAGPSPAARLDLLRALGERLAEVPTPADAAVATLLTPSAPFATRYLLVDVVGRLAAGGDVSALARIGDLALRDPAREVRTRAAEQLGAGAQPEVVAANVLTDPEPRVREAALHAVGTLRLAGPTAAVAYLLGHDPWTFVRVASAEALTTLPASPVADRALGEALTQLSPRVRERAALGLAARDARSYVDAIRTHLTDAKEDPVVRAASARAVGLLCDPKAVEVLTRMAIDGATSQDAAAVALGLVATASLGTLHPADLASRFGPLHEKGARPDARAAAESAIADPVHCPLPRPGR